MCTSDGQIFDHENIVRWLLKHDTNPTNGRPLKQSDLIKLNFTKNDSGDYVDPVTFKIFTDNTHIVAVRHGESANVFAFDTIERLNIKVKMWKDLMSDEDFSRKDIITLQDPQNLASRDLNTFKYITDGEDAGIPKQEAMINTEAMGNAAKIVRAKEALAKARAERATGKQANVDGQHVKPLSKSFTPQQKKVIPYNASHHTTGLAAASFTSTGVTPHTSATLALLSDEEYLLKTKRVKEKGYVQLSTSLGDLTLELYPEYAPKAVWNFVRLSQKGYYDGIKFHRSIKNFMVQGGDPTGTGKGGQSIWGKNFEDEFDGPLKHDVPGVLSMANKGKDTNSSQFFILYREAKHLNRKHTIFGCVIEGLDVLKAMENAETDTNNRPKDDILIEKATVLMDPFDEFWKKKRESDNAEKQTEERRKKGGTDDDKTTWTGKRIRSDGSLGSNEVNVGKYLKAKPPNQHDTVVEYTEEEVVSEPVRKKARGGGGFGNFDGW